MVHLGPKQVIGCPLLAAAVACLMSAGPPAPDPDHAALLKRLDAIESRIDRLEMEGGASWLTTRRAAEITALLSEVLADADARTSMLLDGATAGWDDEFFLESPDGNFRMEISGQVQVRYVWNRRQTASGLDTTEGFEVRRAKVKLSGHLITPQLRYTVGMAKRIRSSAFVLQSFNVRYRFSDQLTVLVGRVRQPVLREDQVSSKQQLAVERSLVARAFRQNRTVGVMVRYKTDRVRLAAGLMDSSLTNQDPSEPLVMVGAPGDDRWRVSTRIEFLLRGRWKDLDDFTSFPRKKPVVSIGAGVRYQWEDLVDPTLNQFGVVIQGGFFVGEEWEFFGRYEYGDADQTDGLLSVVTAGLNRYFLEHAVKLTADVGYGLEAVGDFWASRDAGWLEDEPGESGQIVVRVQMQLLF